MNEELTKPLIVLEVIGTIGREQDYIKTYYCAQDLDTPGRIKKGSTVTIAEHANESMASFAFPHRPTTVCDVVRYLDLSKVLLKVVNSTISVGDIITVHRARDYEESY